MNVILICLWFYVWGCFYDVIKSVLGRMFVSARINSDCSRFKQFLSFVLMEKLSSHKYMDEECRRCEMAISTKFFEPSASNNPNVIDWCVLKFLFLVSTYICRRFSLKSQRFRSNRWLLYLKGSLPLYSLPISGQYLKIVLWDSSIIVAKRKLPQSH